MHTQLVEKYTEIAQTFFCCVLLFFSQGRYTTSMSTSGKTRKWQVYHLSMLLTPGSSTQLGFEKKDMTKFVCKTVQTACLYCQGCQAGTIAIVACPLTQETCDHGMGHSHQLGVQWSQYTLDGGSGGWDLGGCRMAKGHWESGLWSFTMVDLCALLGGIITHLHYTNNKLTAAWILWIHHFDGGEWKASEIQGSWAQSSQANQATPGEPGLY